MTAVVEPAAVIRFEGFTPGTEIWGGTQANFLVQLPGRNAKESAVLLIDPAAKFLAESSGREDSEEFRQEAARAVGEAVLPTLAKPGVSLDSVIMVSRAYLEERPAVLEAALAALRP
jgi:hypothetical protein